MDETNFITKFHNLPGMSIAERKKNLFLLFHQFRHYGNNLEKLQFIASCITPRNHTESLFYADFLIHFQIFDHTLAELLNGNDIVIAKVSKQPWFFKELFKDPTTFLNEAFPNLSHSLRTKLLRKSALYSTEHQNDATFDFVLSKYGFKMAAMVLPGCTAAKIRTILTTYSVTLSTRELKTLLRKDPALIKTYFEEGVGPLSMASHPIFAHIAETNLELYTELFLKYNFKVKLGKRVTKKFISVKKADIVTSPGTYIESLHAGKLPRQLGEEFGAVFSQLFPRSVHEAPNSQAGRLLRHVPKAEQFQLLQSTFDSIFATKLGENAGLIDDYILNMIKDPDDKAKLAKHRITPAPETLKYYKPEECLRVVKEQINFARTPYERSLHVLYLTQSCLFYQDYASLLHVSKYVLERFKNDNIEVISRLFYFISDESTDFGQFTKDHWDLYNAVIYRGHPQVIYCNTTKYFYQYLHFLWSNNQPLGEEIKKYFKNQEFLLYEFTESAVAGSRKAFLGSIIQLVPDITNKVENLDCKLLAACRDYNRHHDDKVTINPRMIQSLTTVLVQNVEINEPVLAAAIEQALCSMEHHEELTDLVFGKFKERGTQVLIKWFLKHKPQTVARYLHSALDYCVQSKDLNKDKKLWLGIKSQPELCTEAATLALSKLNDGSVKNPQYWATSLSYLMPGTDYLKVMGQYAPVTYTVDVEDDVVARIFQIQRYLLKGLNNVKNPTEILSIVGAVCKGDYVKCCLSPMYSACSYTGQVQEFIAVLSKQGAVSVRKHSFHLSAKLLDQSCAMALLNSCDLSQIVSVSLKYLVQNPSPETWGLFTRKLTYFDKEDKVTGNLLASTLVPKPYQVDYLMEMLPRLSHTPHLKVLVRTYSAAKLSKAQFKLLCDLFLELDEMDLVVSNFLMGTESLEHIDMILTRLSAPECRVGKISAFISAFFSTYMKSGIVNARLIGAFRAQFEALFSPSELFEECLMLRLMELKKESLQGFSQAVLRLHNGAVERYESVITETFVSCLKKYLPYFVEQHTERFELYYSLFKLRTSSQDLNMIIKLLPIDLEPEDIDSRKYYEEVLACLQDINEASVQIHLNLYFSQLKVDRDVEYYQRKGCCIYTSSWLEAGARRKIGYNYF